jgi:hypothetical protein
MAALKTHLMEIRRQIAPGGKLAQACDYALNQWSRLEEYLKDGRVEIDNNLVNAARGITPVMPPPVLCRVAKRWRRNLRVVSGVWGHRRSA